MKLRLAALALSLMACGLPVQPRDDAASPMPDVLEHDVSARDDGPSSDAPACGNASQRDCYSGPAATRNVGACRAGVQRCFGGEWGPCVGEATPGAELCGNGADDDCNGVIDCPTDAGLEAGDASPPCVDFDRDGYGVGAGCMGPDCNDDAADTHPGAEERCDGRDNNCDGRTDDASEAAALDAYCRRTASPSIAMHASATPVVCRASGRSLPMPPYQSAVEPIICQACWPSAGGIACQCWSDAVRATNCRVR
jgi:hypothetical protein